MAFYVSRDVSVRNAPSSQPPACRQHTFHAISHVPSRCRPPDLFLYVPERQLSAAEAKNDRLKIRPRPMIFTCSPPVPARSWVGAAAASEYLNILNISAQRADQTRMHVCDAWEHVPGRGAGVRSDVPLDDVPPAPLAR